VPSELSALHTAVLRGQIGSRPAKSVETAARANLPTPLTSSVGRKADIAAVTELVADYRLTTLVGPGGFGKTRLALEVARALLERQPDTAWLVELAPVTEGKRRAVRDAGRAGPPGAVIRRPREGGGSHQLITALRSRSALLVLDNCGHRDRRCRGVGRPTAGGVPAAASPGDQP
jgi:hypothetical protein